MTAAIPSPVGFIGLGNMGWPMARHLIRAGVALRAFDAATARLDAFCREVGGTAAAHPTEIARACHVVITMLPDGQVVRDVLLGTEGEPGLATMVRPGAVVVDMSSSDPCVYPEIRNALQERGADLLDAPVSGAVRGAEEATLTIMVGGEAALVERVRPLLEIMGRRIFHTGLLGSGQAMKALNNLLSAGCFVLSLEVLLIGQRFGLDPQLMTQILNVSTGRNNSTERKILPHVLSRRFDSGFALGLMAKDLTTALGLAEATATATMLSGSVLDVVRQACDQLGGTADHTEIARFLERMVGEELRHPTNATNVASAPRAARKSE